MYILLRPPTCRDDSCLRESLPDAIDSLWRLDELQEQARGRLEELRLRGYQDARIYDAHGTSVGGTHAFFLILGEPEAWKNPRWMSVPQPATEEFI